MALQAVETKSNKEIMFTGGFSTFSVNDVAKAKEFYANTLGLDVSEEEEGLGLKIPGSGNLFMYPKDDHKPATFTVFNLQVDDIQKTVDDLLDRDIQFESYDDPMKTDENGIYWGKKQNQGPNIAWFKDPAGNILSVIEGV